MSHTIFEHMAWVDTWCDKAIAQFVETAFGCNLCLFVPDEAHETPSEANYKPCILS